MAAAVVVQLIAITSNITVDTQHYYLPICTGVQTSGSSVNVSGGGVVILGYNHLGKNATLLTTKTVTTTPEPFPEIVGPKPTQQPEGNRVISDRTTRSTFVTKPRPTQKPRRENPWWKFWVWRRRRRSATAQQREDTTSPPPHQLHSGQHSLPDSRPERQFHENWSLAGHQNAFLDSSQKTSRSKFGTNKKRTKLASYSKSPSKSSSEVKGHLGARKVTYKRATPARPSLAILSSSLIQHWLDKDGGAQNGRQNIMSPKTKVDAGKRTSWAESDFPEVNLFNQSDNDKTRLSPRVKRSSTTESGASSTCSCEISATSEFYLKVMPVVLPDSVDQATAVRVSAGNVSKTLSIFRNDLQFHVFADTSVTRETDRSGNGQGMPEKASSEDTQSCWIRASVFVTSSSTNTSFMVALAVMSYGDINVSCKRTKVQETKGKETSQVAISKTNSTEGQFDKGLGRQAVSAELIAGIVLIVLAVLVVGAVVLWSRYSRTPRGRQKSTSIERGESIAMKSLSYYEEMGDSEAGYFRYSDPMDHRTTVMTSSQVALDNAHIILHHPELGSAKPCRSGAPGKPSPKTPTSAVPGASRYLAELAVGKVKDEEDAGSDVYEEYSNVMVREEQEAELDRDETLRKLKETRGSVEGEQSSSGPSTKQMDQLQQPVIIRVHRKESDSKRPNNAPMKTPPYFNQASVAESSAQSANVTEENAMWDPLTSTHRGKPNDEYVALASPVEDKTRPQYDQRELYCNELDKRDLEQDEATEYINTHDLLSTSTADRVSSEPMHQPNSYVQTPINTGQDFENEYAGEQVLNKQSDSTDHLSQKLSSVKPSVPQQLVRKNSRDFATNHLTLSKSHSVDEADLETYGSASAKPLVDCVGVSKIDSILETYGLTSAKPLVDGDNVSKTDPITKSYSIDGPCLETYGLASAKPLVDCDKASKTDSTLETYGLASAKPLVDCDKASKTDSTLETYGLASAKPLVDCDEASKTDSTLETYGLASAKPLVDCDEASKTDSTLETYGLASAKPLFDGDVASYNLTLAKPLKHSQSLVTDELEAKPLGFLSSELACSPISETEKMGAEQESLNVRNAYSNQNDNPSNAASNHVAKERDALPVEVISVGGGIPKGVALSTVSSAMKPAENKPLLVPSPGDLHEDTEGEEINPQYWESLASTPAKGSSALEISEENVYGNLATLSKGVVGDENNSLPWESEREKTNKDLEDLASGNDCDYESYSQLVTNHPDIFGPKKQAVSAENREVMLGFKPNVGGNRSNISASHIYTDLEEESEK